MLNYLFKSLDLLILVGCILAEYGSIDLFEGISELIIDVNEVAEGFLEGRIFLFKEGILLLHILKLRLGCKVVLETS